MNPLTAHHWLLIKSPPPKQNGWTIYAGIYPRDVIQFGESSIQRLSLETGTDDQLSYSRKETQLLVQDADQDDQDTWEIHTLSENQLVLGVGGELYHFIPLQPTKAHPKEDISSKRLSTILSATAWEETTAETISFSDEMQELNRALFLNHPMRLGLKPFPYQLMFHSFVIDRFGMARQEIGRGQESYGWLVGKIDDSLVLKLCDMANGHRINYLVDEFDASYIKLLGEEERVFYTAFRG